MKTTVTSNIAFFAVNALSVEETKSSSVDTFVDSESQKTMTGLPRIALSQSFWQNIERPKFGFIIQVW